MTPSVLILHNRYRTVGGEEKQVDQQARLLRDRNHSVTLYEEDSRKFPPASILRKFTGMIQMPFSFYHYQKLRALLRSLRPDVAHIHNVFPLLSPSVYYACRDEGVPVIQSVHNYRFMCSNGLFLLPEGQICERCRTGFHWNAALYKCYGGKRARSIAMALTLSLHRTLGTFRKRVSAYIMTSQFLKQKLIEGGFPADKMHLLPPLMEPATERSHEQEPRTLLYIGRIAREKGLETLVKAAQRLPDWTFQVIGQGPLEAGLRQQISDLSLGNMHLLGHVPYNLLQEHLQKATFLVVPSECYENFPTVILEAWFYGLPVIASCLGGMAEAIEENQTGFLFSPGDVESLVDVVRSLSVEKSRSLRKNIQEHYGRRYGADLYYKQLMGVYQNVLT